MPALSTAAGRPRGERRYSRIIALHRTADGQHNGDATVWVPVAGQVVGVEAIRQAQQSRGRDGPQATPATLTLAVSEAIELARSMLGGRENVYAIRVHDRSMSDALVSPGDVIVLARTNEVANGELAAVRVTGKDGRKTTTLKHCYRENGHVRLQPVHPDMPPLYYRPHQVTVQGRVVLVIRQFT